MSDRDEAASGEEAGAPPETAVPAAPAPVAEGPGLRRLAVWALAFGVVNLPFVLARTRFAPTLGLNGMTAPAYNFIWACLNLSLPGFWLLVRWIRGERLGLDASPRQRRRARLRTILRVVALLVSVLSALVMTEVYLRISNKHATWVESNGGSYVSPYRVPSGSSAIFALPDKATVLRQAEFEYEIRPNRDRLWDVEHPVDKPPGEYRVVFLGDSFTMGQGAAFEETWVQVLQGALNGAPREAHVRAFAAGIAGSDPVFQVRLLEDRLLKYSPDLVVQVVNGSDVGDIAVRGGFERFLPGGGLKFRDAPRAEWLMGKSRVARMLLIDLAGYDHYGCDPVTRAARNEEAVEIMVEAGSRLKTLGAKHGFKVLLILHPFRHQIHGGPHAEKFLWEVGLLERARSAGLRTHDLLPFFEREIPPGKVADYFWPIDGHCNPAGYSLFAKGVEEALDGVPGFPKAKK